MPKQLGGAWSAADEWAVEFEVADFLFGLVRLLKPKILLETGCYKGYSTSAISSALSANGFGKLYTCDLDTERMKEALARCGSNGNTFGFTVSGLELIGMVPHPVDFAFLDSGAEPQRADEAFLLNEKLSADSWVAVHDTLNPSGSPNTKQEIERRLGWKSLTFPCPRGLTLFHAHTLHWF
jgi:predicted O-methyltransferase YrrM